jgi:catechol 2,3-dioxygenase-like lactoylglutathione lyase family enzyme
LLFEDQSPHPEGHRFGNVHYAFEVPAVKLEEAAAHVRNQGVDVFGPVQLEWMNATSYYFYDPDANLLEFWARDDS